MYPKKSKDLSYCFQVFEYLGFGFEFFANLSQILNEIYLKPINFGGFKKFWGFGFEFRPKFKLKNRKKNEKLMDFINILFI